MKVQIKAIKQWLAFILTALVAITLFGIIFIRAGIVQPTPEFFMELAIVLILSLLMKVWWYDYTEEKRLSEEDLTDTRNDYWEYISTRIEDINDLDSYLVILNQENKEHYVKNKIGSRTPKKLSEINWFQKLLHPAWKKLPPDEIGAIRYARLYYRIQRKADKLPPVKSEHIMALSNSEQLYDARNHLPSKKRWFQLISTIGSFFLTTALSILAMEQIMLSWANVFRYVGYLAAMTWTIAYTIIKAYKQTGDETIDYFNRLRVIVDKYTSYKSKEVSDGNNQSRITE